MTNLMSAVDLFIYPLKSARGIECRAARVTPTGFEWDRQWMLIDARGVFLSQRTHPKLAQIVPEVTDGALRLNAPQLPPLTVPFAVAGEALSVRVHNDPCIGIEQGKESSEWVSDFIGAPARLVRVPTPTQRMADSRFAGAATAPMGFADGYPILVCNRASLQELNARLPQPIPMDRFRPNIVLEGLRAWAEDHIETVTLGALTLRLVKPCTRCSIPSVDQRTGLSSTDPLPVLRPFRFSKALRGITFGENAVIVSGIGSELERGTSCRVTFDAGYAGATES
jgi:uncharacterized protein YcbX